MGVSVSFGSLDFGEFGCLGSFKLGELGEFVEPGPWGTGEFGEPAAWGTGEFGGGEFGLWVTLGVFGGVWVSFGNLGEEFWGVWTLDFGELG